MITTGSKWFFGLSALTLVLAAAYGWTTGGNGLGPISVGYKGGVGDHVGYGLLLSISALAALLGLVSVSTRDADPEALAQLAGTDEPPAGRPVRHTYWPIVAAFAVASAIVGLVVGAPLFVLGLVAGAVVLVEWMVLAWSDNATGDPEANRQIRNRFMNPIEVPAAGVIGVAVVIFAISRVYLTVPKLGAVWVSIGIAVLILGVGALVAARPKISSSAVAALLLLGAVGTVAAGVISAAVGEREFHEHEEHSTEPAHDEEGG
jgi:hypothetical protein